MRRSTLLLMLLLLAACSRGYGRGELAPSESAALRATLQAYMSAQEVHYSRHTTYADNTAALGITTDGSTLQVLAADQRGHAAVVTHDRHGAGCAVWVGTAAHPRTPRGLDVTEEGRIVCD